MSNTLEEEAWERASQYGNHGYKIIDQIRQEIEEERELKRYEERVRETGKGQNYKYG